MEYRKQVNKIFGTRSSGEGTKLSREESEKAREQWTKLKDKSQYNWDGKVAHLRPLLKLFDDEGMIGNIVLDVGGGRRPLSFFLGKEGRKLLTLDFVKPVIGAGDFHHLKGDIRLANDPTSFARRKAVLQVAEWLGIDPRSAKPEQVDTMIFSEILNYVPYQETLRSLVPYLKPGGLLIVHNQPGRTFEGKGESLLDPEGVKSTPEMMQFIEKLGFRIQFSSPVGKELPKPGNDEFMIFAVFRKENWLERKYHDMWYGYESLNPPNK